jgi:ATP-dependent Clp protease ATP-binding subunit ClpA
VLELFRFRGLTDATRNVDVRAKLRRMVDPGPGWTTSRLRFAPEAKRVLELALHEAVRLRQKRVDTEHVLIALVRTGDGVVPQILADLGASPGDLLRELGTTQPEP